MTNYTPVELAYDLVEPVDYEKDKTPIVFLHGLCVSREYWCNIPNAIANATKRKAASSIFTFETTFFFFFFSPHRSKAKTVHSSAFFLVYRVLCVKPPSALRVTPLQT
ncbi:hypothetical protein TNCV_793231 [Trichonephila clavipes]|nr:hypothetical protein TNCV_793231 [Trichonephila clavipes]